MALAGCGQDDDKDGGTNGGANGVSDGCAFVGPVHGAGWGGPPSCSKTTFTPGEIVTCSVNVVKTADLFVQLLDPNSFDWVGSGDALGLTADGPVSVTLDTAGAVPGTTYVFDYDATPSSASDGVLFVTSETTNNYFFREYRGPGLDSTAPRELTGCALLTLTAQ